MSSRLYASRTAILAALESGGLRTATTGQYAAPVVVVEPGSPWAGADVSLGGVRMGRWRLTAIAGRQDSDGALEGLADLVDAIDDALLTLAGVQLPTWSQPADVNVQGVPYAAASATVQLRTAEG